MASQHLLFLHCKSGDLNGVKYIVESKELDVNVRDGWDSTPLYYACLCGHKEIVEYLLQNGSKCEASTFDGERCLYGALTDDIRNLLRQWKQVHSTALRRDKHYELMRHMLTEDTKYQDISFNIHGARFSAHRCILAVRSSFFSDMLFSKWKNKREVTIKHRKISSEAFSALLQFIYLGRMDVSLDLIDEVKILANQCQLPLLLGEISSAKDKVANLVRLKPSMGRKVKITSVESIACFQNLTSDMRHLAEICLPASLRNWMAGDVLPFSHDLTGASHFPDLCVEVEGQKFMCHKVFLCERSDYFKALISDHFHEHKLDEGISLPIIALQDLSAEMFKHILIYIYAGVEELYSLEAALEVLPVADMMLLPGLKRLCGNVMSAHIDTGNVVAMYRCSHTFDLVGLENRCTSFMATELENLVEMEDFMDLAMEEANQVRNREETDSIPVIDDIRYHVTNNVSTYSQMDDAHYKLSKLDTMLARLGIEC